MPWRAGNEKASARARGLQIDGVRKRSYPNRTKALQCRRAFRCLPRGRPKECSSRRIPVKLRDRRASRSDACPPGGPCRAMSERGRSSPATASPSSFTPPWEIIRRASLVERPNADAITAGTCTGSSAGSACSGMSVGVPPSRTTRVKCSSAARAASSPCERMTMNRASSSFASMGSDVRYAAARRRAPTTARASRRECASSARTAPRARAVERDVVAHGRAHLRAVPREQERRGEDHLRLEAVRLHDRPPGEQVVELVRATELHVRLDRDRVVRLHERIQELGDGDRLTRAEPLGEVVALEDLRDRRRAGQAKHVREVETGQPLAVVSAPPSAPDRG